MSPQIFVSCVSKEFKSARTVVSRGLNSKSFIAETQEIFGTEEGDLREVIRRKIDKCVGLIQIVGLSYGAEPPTPDPQWGQISYTQFELLYARSKGKKIWIIEADDSFPRDHPIEELDQPRHTDPSDPASFQADRFTRQQQYIEQLRQTGLLRHSVNSLQSLELKIEQMHNELRAVRKSYERWKRNLLATIAALTLATAAGFAYTTYTAYNAKRQAERDKENLEELQSSYKDFHTQNVLNQQIASLATTLGSDALLPTLIQTRLELLKPLSKDPGPFGNFIKSLQIYSKEKSPKFDLAPLIQQNPDNEKVIRFHARLAIAGIAVSVGDLQEADNNFAAAQECIANVDDDQKIVFYQTSFEYLLFHKGPAKMKAQAYNDAANAYALADQITGRLQKIDKRSSAPDWILFRGIVLLEQARASLATGESEKFSELISSTLNQLETGGKNPLYQFHISRAYSLLADYNLDQKSLTDAVKNRGFEIDHFDFAYQNGTDNPQRITWEIEGWKARIKIMQTFDVITKITSEDWLECLKKLELHVSEYEKRDGLDADLSWKSGFMDLTDPLLVQTRTCENQLNVYVSDWKDLVEFMEGKSRTIILAANDDPTASTISLQIQSTRQAMELCESKCQANQEKSKSLQSRIEKLDAIQIKDKTPKLQLTEITAALRHLDIPNKVGVAACIAALSDFAKRPGDDLAQEMKLAAELAVLIEDLFRAEANLSKAYSDRQTADVRVAELLARAQEYEIPNRFGTRRLETARQCREEAATLETSVKLEVNRRSENMLQAIQRTAELLRVHHEAGNDEVTVAIGGLIYAITERTAPTLDFELPVTKAWVEQKKAARSQSDDTNTDKP